MSIDTSTNALTPSAARELAMDLFSQGMNCAQAVFVAFCDQTGLDRRTALRISSSFGGGIGRLREVCGAVSGMAMAAGMLRGYDDITDPDAKAAHYAFIHDLAMQFKQENGSYICRELLDLPEDPDNPVTGVPAGGAPVGKSGDGTPQYRLRPCAEYVGNAAALLAAALREPAGTQEA
jgi:C_GCAxxG_C_C family probable redox protein